MLPKIKDLINSTSIVVLIILTAFTCGVDENPPGLSENEIISFDFFSSKNDQISIDVIGEINQANRTIVLNLPFGVEKKSLYTSIEVSNGATVSPAGNQAYNFSEPMKFSVTAGALTIDYRVTVNNLEEGKSKILKFDFEKAKNKNLTTDLIGVVKDDSELIYINAPCGMEQTKFVPTIEISPGAKINPPSDKEQDFLNGAVYSVTSSNGKVSNYKITLTNESSDRQILIDFFLANPDSRLDWNIEAPMEAWRGITLENCRVADIFLTDSKISKVPSSFGGLSELKSLNFGNNEIEEIPDELGNLNKLEQIQLEYNQLKSLPSGLGNLKSIARIWLDGNDISEIPTAMGNLSTLIMLSMINNQVKGLPVDFLVNNLINLKYLRLTGNNIKVLPKEIGHLTQLEELTLVGNSLISLPPEIGKLKRLNKLTLAKNQLLEVPEEMVDMQALQILDLGGNQLSSLPQMLGKMTSLKELDLRENQFTQIPIQVSNLPNIRGLRFSYNQINSIPLEISQLKSLTSFWMNDNEISEIPAELSELTKLQYLSFFRNKLTSVPMVVCDLRKLGCEVQLDSGVQCK